MAGVEGVTGEAGVFDLPGPPLPAAIPAPSVPTSPVTPVADPFLGSPHVAPADPADRADDPLPREAAGGVLLRLGGSRFAVAMADVAEVTPLPPVTRLPGAPEWLSGVANWRGRMLPVIDIRSLVGVPVIPLATSARLVVVAAGSRGELTAGLVAEAVPGVYDVAIETMLAPPATLPAEAARLIAGQVTDLLGPIAVLDVASLLALRERVDRRRHGS